MQLLPPPVARLIDEFSRLPGIGPKTASRLTFFLLRGSSDGALNLASALNDLHQSITLCSRCFHITQTDPCPICLDQNRDQTTICVVEEPLDVLAIERTRSYTGLYHVLHGIIAPVEGVGPEDIKIAQLVERVPQTPTLQEIIIATNPNMEGEATAMYISRLLAQPQLKITRLARGLPVGGDLEYADEITLSRALSGRIAM